MKLQDFYGKWFLRDGDLRPEEINENALRKYKFGLNFLESLQNDGLLFDNYKDAMVASCAVRKIAAGISDHTIMPEDMIATVEAEEEEKPRIYISGPISGHNIEECIERFNKVEEELVFNGFRVFNPLNNGLPFDADTRMHMRRDLNILTNEDDPFDYIYMMKRWPHSAGCKLELDTAIACGISVMFEEVGDAVKFE